MGVLVFVLPPALLFLGLLLLIVFFFRLRRDMGTDKDLSGYIYKIGIPSALVFAGLVLQRLVPLAIAFLSVMAVLGCCLFAYRKLAYRPAAPAETMPDPDAPALVDLGKYAAGIGDKDVARKLQVIQRLVEAIRAIAGYRIDTVDAQKGDVRKMESVYLPNIERLVQQYIKITRHDSLYDSTRLLSNLDKIADGIRQLYLDVLREDKLAMDADSDALITAMEIDGLTSKHRIVLHEEQRRPS